MQVNSEDIGAIAVIQNRSLYLPKEEEDDDDDDQELF